MLRLPATRIQLDARDRSWHKDRSMRRLVSYASRSMLLKRRRSVKFQKKDKPELLLSAAVPTTDSDPPLKSTEMPSLTSKEPLYSTEPIPPNSPAYWNNVIYEATTSRKISSDDLELLLGDATVGLGPSHRHAYEPETAHMEVSRATEAPLSTIGSTVQSFPNEQDSNQQQQDLRRWEQDQYHSANLNSHVTLENLTSFGGSPDRLIPPVNSSPTLEPTRTPSPRRFISRIGRGITRLTRTNTVDPPTVEQLTARFDQGMRLSPIRLTAETTTSFDQQMHLSPIRLTGETNTSVPETSAPMEDPDSPGPRFTMPGATGRPIILLFNAPSPIVIRSRHRRQAAVSYPGFGEGQESQDPEEGQENQESQENQENQGNQENREDRENQENQERADNGA